MSATSTTRTAAWSSKNVMANQQDQTAKGVDPKLLEILVCPVTKEPLRYDPERQELISEKARLAYPIRDGIPIMLPDEARSLDEP